MYKERYYLNMIINIFFFLIIDLPKESLIEINLRIIQGQVLQQQSLKVLLLKKI